MGTVLTLPFTPKDQEDLREFKDMVESGEVPEPEPQNRRTVPRSSQNPSDDNNNDNTMKRHRVRFPAIETGTEKTREAVEEALKSGSSLPRGNEISLPQELIDKAKAAFIASGGNISEVAALYDLTTESVLRLAANEEWPVYGGSTKVNESKSRSQLLILRDKLWHQLEDMLDALNVEKKQKQDIVQYRAYSEYVEPLSSRSSAFKALMDQYMRVSTLLEPEVFVNDPDGGNFHARNARGENYPGGIEGVNREMADFLSEVVVGIADKIKDRELQGYGDIIDARAR